ncbi:dicarboxylate/amino acid:cation symporter [Halanaerobacter jeridensis]|uniref:Na+/H+-dicarboxylate symporter n=1 Tax=Halanaerobacter jeridensis TaxID=706427 RepID=A0A938XWR9_9FIRM|nr:dicarboxylate/amino acid:cation symporter [Halanaerobacter jeridensis]MBM7556710.1 Na+/H+-dicarboxylate symporter [Halanaerobacter jeridensis]
MKKFGLLPRLIVGIIIGLIVGTICMNAQIEWPIELFKTFNSIFGSFLNYIIPFIILAFVAPGIAELGKKASKLLGLATGIAYLSTIIAGTSAFFIGKSLLPILLNGSQELNKVDKAVKPLFEINIPPFMKIMTALVTAFMIGLGMANAEEDYLYNVIKDFQEIIQMVIKTVIIPLLPVHIAGIIANMSYVGKVASTMAAFGKVFILILGLQISYVIVQYLIACQIGNRNPITAIKNMLPAYFTAIGTQSSAATIPVTVQSVLDNDVKEDIADFVVPLGATIHLAGDTITLTLASMAVMMLHGQTVTFGAMMPFILMLGITMVAAPGIPGGGVMASLGLLEGMLGFGATQKSLMIALHLAQDSFGTASNIMGDGAISIIMDSLSDDEE